MGAKIQVCVCAEKIPDLFSWRIMRQFKEPVSHIYIEKDGFIYEAADKGVAKVPIPENMEQEHYVVGRKQVELLVDDEGFEAWFKTHEGKEYGTDQIPGYIVPSWLKWAFRNGRSRGICCEFVRWAMHDLTDHPKFRDESESDFCKPYETFQAI